MSSLESFYKQYDCSYNAPLSCKHPLETAEQIKGARFCLECGFPATLPIEVEIKGNRGTYQVTKFLGVRDLGRLYAGVQLKNQEPVIIKEYLLPQRCFSPDEASKRKESFKRVGGVNLADGREQNFRLIQTWEAIADEEGRRCYLITKDTEPSETLGQYLKTQGAMKAPKVREFLNQALQTLIFLHTQKLSFPSNQVQKGLEHGNINLDSVLIKSEKKQPFFLIYFCDLAKWENLFIPADIPQPPAKTYKEDLESLGLLAFYLWLGRTTNYNTGKKIDPTEHELLPNNDNDLKKFIYRLLGFDAPFKDAQTARQILLNLSQENKANNIQPSTKKSQQSQKRFPIYRVLLGVLALLLLSGGIWYYLWSRGRSEKSIYSGKKLTPKFSEVNNLPEGDFYYTADRNSTWHWILEGQPKDEIKLEDLLKEPNPEVKATFKYEGIDIKTDSKEPTGRILIKKVKDKEKDFVITSLKDIITDDMDKEEIAYDGLLVFVTFSKSQNSLLRALQGKITLEQLRKIYTGKAKMWSDIAPNLPKIPIKPYVPTEVEAVEKFKQLVLNDHKKDIALFDRIAKSSTEWTGKTQRKMSEQRERKKEETGIISFGILNKTLTQCGGYPLAIVDKNNQPIQPIFRKNTGLEMEISDNFCDRNHYLDVKTFKDSYPLRYYLYVVYPKDNSLPRAGSAFADILKTLEGQCLLSKVGLVPLQPIPKSKQNNNVCE